jgi:hypothetical protein
VSPALTRRLLFRETRDARDEPARHRNDHIPITRLGRDWIVAEAVAWAGCARQRRNERVTEIEEISTAVMCLTIDTGWRELPARWSRS